MILRRFALATLLLTAAVPAHADDPVRVEKRVDRLEKEMKAVQRKVFPGGNPAFFEPEIAPPPAAAVVGVPATPPLAELTQRVSSLEKALAQLTNQVEQDEHRLDMLADAAKRDHDDLDARLKALEAANAPAAAPAVGAAVPPPGAPAKAAPAPSKPAPAQGAAMIGDNAEDAYMAGYHLWADKKYAAAEDQLSRMIAKYPKTRRTSYARNLLGRAYLDDGQPAQAARVLLDNYKDDPRGERAPDSLYYLGVAVTQLKDNQKACQAFDELQSVYGDSMSATLKAKLPDARGAAHCDEADRGGKSSGHRARKK